MLQKPKLWQLELDAGRDGVDQAVHATRVLSGSARSEMTGLSPPLHSYLGLGTLIDISSEEWLADDFESEEVRGQTRRLVLSFMSCHLHEGHSPASIAAHARSSVCLLLRSGVVSLPLLSLA